MFETHPPIEKRIEALEASALGGGYTPERAQPPTGR
jgi:hypothetical protein